MKISPSSPPSHLPAEECQPAEASSPPPPGEAEGGADAVAAVPALSRLPHELVERVFLCLPRARDQAALIVAYPRGRELSVLADSAYARARESYHGRRLAVALNLAAGGLCCAEVADVLAAARGTALPFVRDLTLRLRGRDVGASTAVAAVIGQLAADAPHLRRLTFLAVPLPARLPAALAAFGHLTRLTLAGSVKRHLRHLVRAPAGLDALTGLRELTLANMRPGNGQLEGLTALLRLESLRLEQLSPADDAVDIATRCAGLTAVGLAMLTDLHALPPRQGWTRLRTLRVRDCERLYALSLAGDYLPGLRELDLSGCPALMVPWGAVRAATGLTALDLRGAPGDALDDEVDLRRLPLLQKLNGAVECIGPSAETSPPGHLDAPILPLPV